MEPTLLQLKTESSELRPKIRDDIAAIHAWASALPNDALVYGDEALRLFDSLGMRTTAYTLAYWRRVGRGPPWVKAGKRVAYPVGGGREYVRRLHADCLARQVAA